MTVPIADRPGPGAARRFTRSRGLGASLVLALPVVAAACAPVSPAVAARECEARANLSVHPRGEVYTGYTTAGGGRPVVGGKIEVSSDTFSGRDPYELYDTCVRQMSGQGPIRPLVLR